MNNIYLDNASTSFPKAPLVSDAIKDFIDNVGTNVNRSSYVALSAEEKVFEVREKLAGFFNHNNPMDVVFTQNITISLNVILSGLLRKGDHCIISSLEHNAVMRPLSNLLKTRDITFTKLRCDKHGFMLLDDLKPALQKNTKAVIMTHASNVSGTINPVGEVGKFCFENGLKFVLDAAQSAGVLPVDMMNDHIDALGFTGHKGLLGPQGIGGFILAQELKRTIEPLYFGGTGSFSESEEQPESMPDKFESGTMNIPGIYGLDASLTFIKEEGMSNIFEREMSLCSLFLSLVKDLKGVKIIGPPTSEGRVAVVSLDFIDKDNGEIAHLLSKEHGISTRSGLHCAVSAHRALGTFPKGTVRFSFGHANTKDQVYAAIEAIRKCIAT